jgi:Uma2 family endonuclease
MVAAMSTAPTGYGRPFTRADLERMPDDGRRYELIDGVLIVSAAPGRVHQRAAFRLARLLDDACPAEFEVLMAPFAVGLADDTEMQPDVLVGRRDQLTDRDLPAPPSLAVEVLSPSTRMIDLTAKRKRFERAGTTSFWVVDPTARAAEARLMAWELGPDGAYVQVADVTGEKEFGATLPYPVSVIPAELVR